MSQLYYCKKKIVWSKKKHILLTFYLKTGNLVFQMDKQECMHCASPAQQRLNANLGAGVLAGMSLPFAPALKHYHSMIFDTKIDHFFHFSYRSGS